MDKQTQLLCDLFAGVPGPDDLIGKAGGRIIEAVMNTTGIVPDILGPIASPREWLARYGIAIEEGSPSEMANGKAAALFQHPNGDGRGARVLIPIGYDIDDHRVGWTVWHEIGHAADYIGTNPEGRLMPTPAGVYSTQHEGALRQHQDVIVTWSNNNTPENYDYKHSLSELWAECVACAVMKTAQVPPPLLAAILPHLIKRNFPIDPIWHCLDRNEVADRAAAIADLGRDALLDLKHFMSAQQTQIVRDFMKGEEAEFFHEKMIELAAIVKSMPETGETDDGRGGKAIAYLHYFAGGQANFYVTERDVGDKDDPNPGEQHQAFGRSDLFNDGGELGYISLPEIFRSGGELDFHWTPKTLDEIEAKRTAREDAP